MMILMMMKNIFKYGLNDTLAFGKYKFKTVKFIIDTDINYINWLRGNATHIFLMDKDSMNYLTDRIVINSLLYVRNKARQKR